ncbi:bestrophin family protein [Mycolicibacterium brumae]|nr:bestrophin family ion channel [Mycolicibacterium brumae]RWA20552.1 hypothetical protein MBRU_02530 [Mycolicibacterium brumae DSM 44177]UWW07650.1 hypothetical protein L2Z93_000675 [Mycolicibacterium brumae]
MLIRKRIPVKMIVGRTWHELLLAAGITVGTFFADKYLANSEFEFPTVVPTLLGTALAFFIGFSNSQAYDRWWEARVVWGAITNESRSWARNCLNNIDGERAVAERMVLRQIAFVYALKDTLRGASDAKLKQDVVKYLTDDEYAELADKKNKHNALLDWHSRDLERLRAGGNVDGFRFIEFNERIVKLCDEMGKAERIRNTVFPPTYNYYTRLFVWIFIASLTVVLSTAVGVLGIVLAFAVGYVFLVSQGIGMTLLNPFEPTIFGTPLDQISRTIEINLLEMLGRTDLPEPWPSVHDDYVT